MGEGTAGTDYSNLVSGAEHVCAYCDLPLNYCRTDVSDVSNTQQRDVALE